MGLMHYITKLFELRKYVGVVLFSFVFFTCERGVFYASSDCADCYLSEPEIGDLVIDVTINAENDSVPVKLYKGKLDEDELVFVDTCTIEEYGIDVPLDGYYTLVAEYEVNGKTIRVVDGDKIKTSKYYECDEVCYRVVGGYIDVRLKFDNIE